MKIEEKNAIVGDLLSVFTEKRQEDERLQMVLNYLPFFKKEIIKDIIDPILNIEKSFEIGESFLLEVSEEERYSVTFLEIIHDIHSSWCIKKSKIFAPGKTIFLGTDGIDLLKKFAAEKIYDKKMITFSCRKKITERNYINGIRLYKDDHFQRTSFCLDATIRKGYTIAVFKQL